MKTKAKTKKINWKALRKDLAMFDGIPANHVNMNKTFYADPLLMRAKGYDIGLFSDDPVTVPVRDVLECGAVGCFIGWAVSHGLTTGKLGMQDKAFQMLRDSGYNYSAETLYGIDNELAASLFGTMGSGIHPEDQKRGLAYRMVAFFKHHKQPVSKHWRKMAKGFAKDYRAHIKFNKKNCPVPEYTKFAWDLV